MKDKKGSYFLIALPILLPTIIIITFIIIYFIGKSRYTSTKIYEINWDIDIPKSFDETYTAHTSSAFDGGGKRFTIYHVNDTSDFFDGFREVKDTSIEDEFLSNLEGLEIPDKNIPEFNKRYMYRKYVSFEDENDWLIIFYIPQEKQCFFTQNMG